jgi:16S rRNA (guanine1516-N2)-methyltransferase
MLPLQVLCLPETRSRAAELALRLGVPLQILPDFHRKTLKRLASSLSLALMVGDDVSLQTFDQMPLPGPVRVDWADGQTLWRLQHGGGRGEMLAKACGIKGACLPKVVDATAGFGRDSLLLAWLGCQVTMLERSPLVRALLEDGWTRALAEPLLADTLARMTLVFEDSAAWLSKVEAERPDVVYLDPMFPSREKAAKVKVNMQVFHLAVGADPDADALLEPALKAAGKRVVVKRPRLAEPLAGKAPSLVLEGESSRFDVYMTG